MVIIYYIIFCLIHFCICLQNSALNLDTNCDDDNNNDLLVEFFKKDDSLFMFFSEEVAWFEASSICKTYEAELAMLNSTMKVYSIAYFLDDSNFTFKEFWIGAKKVYNEWIWIDGQFVKNSRLTIPWPKDVNHLGKDCLVVKRQSRYNTPTLVDSSCYLLKPFICERSRTTRTTRPLLSLPVQKIKIGDSIFTLFHSNWHTWHGALVFCRAIGQRLAVVPNSMYVNKLAREMLRARPSMEFAWIGGYYSDETWEWIATGDIIPDTTNDPTYPPWYGNNSRSYVEACLLLDRHLIYSYFLPSFCKKRSDFICERYIDSHRKPIINDTIKCRYDSGVMFIYLIDKNWNDAQAHCLKENMILAEPLDKGTLKALAVCLGDHPAEPKHVWLGGRYMRNKWIWTSSKKEVDNSLPWCDDEFEENSDCLNMDRTDHDEPWIYGLKCRKKQPFVCEKGEVSTTTERSEEIVTTPSCECPCRQPPISMNYDNKTFTAYLFNIEANEMSYYCKYYGGKGFSSKYSNTVQNYVLAYIRLSITFCDCCTDDAINFWIADASSRSCLTINLASGKVTKATNCKRKNPFICESYCTSEPKLAANENATIQCEITKAAGALPYKSCKFSCGYGYSMFGPERFTCNKYGWKISNIDYEQTPFLFPECIKIKSTAETLIKLLGEVNPQGLYFALKEPIREEYTKWQTFLQFASSILQVFPISKRVPMGLLSFGEDGVVKMPYTTTDTCMALKTINNILRSYINVTHTNYNAAFNQIQAQIARHHPNRRTLIFFLVDTEDSAKNYRSAVRNLQKNHIIFVVAITNGKFIYDLDAVASSAYNYRLYTMKVRDYSALTNTSLDLLVRLLPKADLGLIQTNVTYYVIKNFVTHIEAEHQCKNKYGGKLMEQTASQNFVKETNIKQFQILNFWIEKTKTNKCASIDIYSKMIEMVNCNDKLPFMCMIDCSVLPPDEKGKQQSMNEVHSFDCLKHDDVLKGAPALQCSSSAGGWSTVGYRTAPFPVCLSASEWIKETTVLLNAKRDTFKAGILFVVDESTTDLKKDFETNLKFVETILKLYPASRTRPYGLITFSDEAYLRIPYNEGSSCNMLKKLGSMRKQKLSYTPSYEQAILLVDKEITEYRSTKLTIVFVLTTGVFSENLLTVREAVRRLLRYNVEIYLIKVGTFDSEIATEIPTRDFQYNLNVFSFRDYTTLSKLSSRLLTESNKTAVKC